MTLLLLPVPGRRALSVTGGVFVARLEHVRNLARVTPVVMFFHGQDFIKHQYHRDTETFLLALARDLAFGDWTFDRPSRLLETIMRTKLLPGNHSHS
jgi:hypothetical protein